MNRGVVEIPDVMSLRDEAETPASKELAMLEKYFSNFKVGNVSRGEVGKVKGPVFKVYKSDSVKSKLNELFYGKCAYCESFYPSTAPVDVEHYRPKGGVDEDPEHPGYWWVAMDWSNLLPSCIHCNRRSGQITPDFTSKMVSLLEGGRKLSRSMFVQVGKQNSFPIMGERAREGVFAFESEQPLLLDPCRDDPDEHLQFYVEPSNLIGLVLPKIHKSAGLIDPRSIVGVRPDLREVVNQAIKDGVSLRGAISIHVYGLNRLGLIQERTRLLRQLDFLEMLVLEISSMVENLSSQRPCASDVVNRLGFLRDQIVREMKELSRPEAPYSAMVREWLEGFKIRLRGSQG